MKIAIMQPTFIPWIGYFSMMQYVDKFVILDNVQFDKRSWQQRNKIRTKEESIWLTIPVKSKKQHLQKINEVEILYDKDFICKIIKTIESNYKKTSFYNDFSSELFSLMLERPKFLSDLTIKLIIYIKEYLEIKTEIIIASDMNVEGKKDTLLANICQLLKASRYISPVGSQIYLDNSLDFKSKEIKIEYFDFIHPNYKQTFFNFMPYMSIIDLIFNFGPKSKEYLPYIKKD